MQLEYKILWADDSDDNIETYSHPIVEFLEDEGFVSKIYPCRTKIELESAINQNMNYNLIILDFKFNDKPVGTDFIRYIREKNIYSTIILYTAAKDVKLPEEVYKSKVQNVYTLTKHEIADDRSLITNIIRYDLYKDLDINSMRGIAMAEVSNMDKIIWDILIQENIPQEHIITYIRNGKENFYNEYKNKDDKLIWKELNKQNRSTMHFPSNDRAIFLKEYLESLSLTELQEIIELIDVYKSEIITPRNQLAHQNTYEEMNQEECNKKFQELRKNIIKHKNNLIELIKLRKDHLATVETSI